MNLELAKRFLELQEKHLYERREKEKRKKEKEEQEQKEMQKSIESFFVDNRDTIIDKTITYFIKEMEKKGEESCEDKEMYEKEYEIPTSLFFGCSRNEYNKMLEKMIKKELKEYVKKGKITVCATCMDKPEGYWANGVDWIGTGTRRIMHIIICFSF